ncbi:MAG: 3-phenylpropionate/trans-cinnamate dioxygenase ferredoxin subunit [Mariniblastus sp.]|jgi:3-phenylpropionate/trans-cinnamate dioxygenase ferredoxin subunit
MKATGWSHIGSEPNSRADFLIENFQENMSEFIKLASKSDLAEGATMLVEADDRLVILSRIGDEYFCIDDICTHDGGTLSDGEHSGCEIACPRHGAKFDLRTGKALCMPATQNTAAHKVKVDGDDILVKINEE